MLNREINVFKAGGTWGPAGAEVDDYNKHRYFSPVPETEEQAESARELIAKDLDEVPAKTSKVEKSKGKRAKTEMSFIKFVGRGGTKKDLIYRFKSASEFKLYSDGSWDYDLVTSEDKNDKYVLEED